MSTNIELDDDVVEALEQLARTHGTSPGEVLREVLGLRIAHRAVTSHTLFRQRSFDLGKPLVKSFDRVSAVLAAGEGEDYR